MEVFISCERLGPKAVSQTASPVMWVKAVFRLRFAGALCTGCDDDEETDKEMMMMMMKKRL